MNKIRVTLLTCFTILLSSFSTDNTTTDPFSKDLLEINGELIEHAIHASIERLSDNKILELQDENGLTIWFARFFYKDICVTGLCNMARFWIFWDGTGNYLGYRLNDNEPLTKSNHIDFQSKDYIRLDEILKDTESILQDFEYSDLAFESEVEPEEEVSITVDAFTSATPPVLSEYVVEDAVFTCYTLWHTVYGETKDMVQDILGNRITPSYVEKLLSGNKGHKIFAIEQIALSNSLFEGFEDQMFNIIISQDVVLSKITISAVPDEYFENAENQLKFINLLENSLPEIKFEIIYRLQFLNNLSTDAILQLLDMHLEGTLSVGALNQVYKIVSKSYSNKNVDFDEIKRKIEELSQSPKPETANLSANLFKSIQ